MAHYSKVEASPYSKEWLLPDRQYFYRHECAKLRGTR